MDLPINDNELETVIRALSIAEQWELAYKLRLVKNLMDKGLPYKKILREEHGMVA